MPRSNKKKKTTHLPSSAQPILEPPPNKMLTNPRPETIPDQDISFLLTKEKTLMIDRCIQSAQKHEINLKHGTSNPGTVAKSQPSIARRVISSMRTQQRTQRPPPLAQQCWILPALWPSGGILKKHPPCLKTNSVHLSPVWNREKPKKSSRTSSSEYVTSSG